jgi:septum formation protein
MLILASQSPRRHELLARAGLTFLVRVPGIEEVRIEGEDPAVYVERLAREKAGAVACDPGDWVLAADTVVVLDHHVLEKPVSSDDARRMLGLLSGRDHEVLTGVCLRRGPDCWAAVESTRVVFAPLSEAEVQHYVASGEPMDKAGAYAIQGLASKFVTSIQGCFFNVMGLPVSRVYRMMTDAGYPL